MGAGLQELSTTTAVAVGQTSHYIYTATDDKKRDKDFEEKRRRQKLISEVLPILEDVRLQCPQTHSGLIIAYSVSENGDVKRNSMFHIFLFKRVHLYLQLYILE
jgi:hypothetical protein